MTYTEFKTFLATFLWKDSDTALLANLDSLIRMGNNTLNRRLKTIFRDDEVSITVRDQDYYEFVEIYRSIRSVNCTEHGLSHSGEFLYVEPGDLYALRAKVRNSNWQKVYSVVGDRILFVGPADELQIKVVFSKQIPLTDETVNWWFEEFLDAYTYAVLKHAAPYLREDERVPLWTSMYNEAIAEVEEQYYFDHATGQMNSYPQGRAAGVRRRGDRGAHRQESR